MEKLYTMESLAQYLGVSVRTILREKAAGKIGFKRIRGQVRFSQDDLDVYLNRNSFADEGRGDQEVAQHAGVNVFTKPRRT